MSPTRWKNIKEWKEYGKKRGYGKRSPSSLEKSEDEKERSWYRKGSREKWARGFNFQLQRVTGRWNSAKEWQEFGVKRRYQNKNPTSLHKSEDPEERAWYKKGVREGWADLVKFYFERKHITGRWKTEKEWKLFGTERKYRKKIPSALAHSEEKDERSWYNKGSIEGWLGEFDFDKRRVIGRWETKKEWQRYGMDNDYNGRSPKSLSESDDAEEKSWYNKGIRNGWLDGFELQREQIQGRWKTEKEWKLFGIKKGYRKKNPSSFQKSENPEERAWYSRGNRNKWLHTFDFARKQIEGRWKNLDEWKKFGVGRKYYQRSPSNLSKSNDHEERAWYNKGWRENWLDEIEFKREQIQGRWKTEKEWIDYGLGTKYDERNPSDLAFSKDKNERAWYSRGNRNKWLHTFDFARKQIEGRWKTVKEWREFGVKRRYQNKNPTALNESEDPEERAWYGKGLREKWVRNFAFIRQRTDGKWSTEKEWRAYGKERQYKQKTPSSFQKSKIPEERAWYRKGLETGWLENFEIQKKRIDGKWKAEKQWGEYGVERGYEKRSPSSLKNSDNNEERAWYRKGYTNGWLENFELARGRSQISSPEKFAQFLEKNKTAQNLAAATMASGENSPEFESIFYDLYGDKFKDRKMFQELLQKNKDEIMRLAQQGLTNLGTYLGEFSLNDRNIIPIFLGNIVDSLPEEKVSSLESRLVSLMRNSYGPLFNEQPQEIIGELEKKVEKSTGAARSVYQNLRDHYQETLQLREELK